MWLTSLISCIFFPPLPIIEPHWLAGTISLNVTGGLGAVGDVTVLDKSCKEMKNRESKCQWKCVNYLYHTQLENEILKNLKSTFFSGTQANKRFYIKQPQYWTRVDSPGRCVRERETNILVTVTYILHKAQLPKPASFWMTYTAETLGVYFGLSNSFETCSLDYVQQKAFKACETFDDILTYTSNWDHNKDLLWQESKQTIIDLIVKRSQNLSFLRLNSSAAALRGSTPHWVRGYVTYDDIDFIDNKCKPSKCHRVQLTL